MHFLVSVYTLAHAEVRCTVAEEQLDQLQANTKAIISEYQRKIVELKRMGTAWQGK